MSRSSVFLFDSSHPREFGILEAQAGHCLRLTSIQDYLEGTPWPHYVFMGSDLSWRQAGSCQAWGLPQGLPWQCKVQVLVGCFGLPAARAGKVIGGRQ